MRDAVDGAMSAPDPDQPWAAGYNGARAVRARLGLEPTDVVPLARWVASATRSSNPFGPSGLGGTDTADKCRLVVPDSTGHRARRFAAARAVGRALMLEPGSDFLLTGSRGASEATARAFAAELLAPADGVKEMLKVIGRGEQAVQAVAAQFEVSSEVVSLQVANQLYY